MGGARFAEALRIRPLGEDAAAIISRPRHVHRFSLPVRMDDGTLQVFTGWRVRYSDVFGPTKGGVRFHPETSEESLTALAFRLLLKCAVNGLPHGGAGGGVRVDPRRLSRRELERLAHRYVDAVGDGLSPDRDILSPDLGTDAETMRWMVEEYRRVRRTADAAAINGKPLALGGIPGRPGSTARGAWTVLREVLQSRGLGAKGLTFAVQGYGSAGGRLAVLLEQEGLRLVAAADASGGWHDPRGLDAGALWQAKADGRRFAALDLPRATRTDPVGVLAVPADIVIPAAVANQITSDLAPGLQCRLVLEVANGPIASDAEALVASKAVVVPDLVANAGGITMSHFEWVQNRTGLPWTEEDARARLDARMRATARAMIDTARERNVTLAVAPQLIALDRLAAALA